MASAIIASPATHTCTNFLISLHNRRTRRQSLPNHAGARFRQNDQNSITRHHHPQLLRLANCLLGTKDVALLFVLPSVGKHLLLSKHWPNSTMRHQLPSNLFFLDKRHDGHWTLLRRQQLGRSAARCDDDQQVHLPVLGSLDDCSRHRPSLFRAARCRRSSTRTGRVLSVRHVRLSQRRYM